MSDSDKISLGRRKHIAADFFPTTNLPSQTEGVSPVLIKTIHRNFCKISLLSSIPSFSFRAGMSALGECLIRLFFRFLGGFPDCSPAPDLLARLGILVFAFIARKSLAAFIFFLSVSSANGLYAIFSFLRKSFLFFAFVRALCPRACVCEIKVVTLHRVLWALGNEYCNKPSASRPNRTTE